jgi:predicted nucleotidyltransferase
MNRAEALSVLNRVRHLLEARGVIHAGLFGSVARGEAGPKSDIDIVVSLKPEAGRSLFNLGGIQTLLEEAFPGRGVDVVVEPVLKGTLRAAIERDRAHAF